MIYISRLQLLSHTDIVRKKETSRFLFFIPSMMFGFLYACTYDIELNLKKWTEITKLLIFRTHNHCLHTDTLSSLYNDRGASVIFANLFDELAEAFPNDQITRLQDLIRCKSIVFLCLQKKRIKKNKRIQTEY